MKQAELMCADWVYLLLQVQWPVTTLALAEWKKKVHFESNSLFICQDEDENESEDELFGYGY